MGYCDVMHSGRRKLKVDNYLNGERLQMGRVQSFRCSYALIGIRKQDGTWHRFGI